MWRCVRVLRHSFNNSLAVSECDPQTEHEQRRCGQRTCLETFVSSEQAVMAGLPYSTLWASTVQDIQNTLYILFDIIRHPTVLVFSNWMYAFFKVFKNIKSLTFDQVDNNHKLVIILHATVHSIMRVKSPHAKSINLKFFTAIDRIVQK